jgi:cytochrome b subunit of formate dehydrogenase
MTRPQSEPQEPFGSKLTFWDYWPLMVSLAIAGIIVVFFSVRG